MEQELIGSWLDIPPGAWPLDHYSLLGLARGEGDRARIERHVQERLEKVRHFQLAHPEQATEVMNRLAQAFVCLTDPQAKQAYDAILLTAGSAVAANGHVAADLANSGVEDKQPASPPIPPLLLDWRLIPPPQRGASTEAKTPTVSADETVTLHDSATAAAVPAVPAAAEPTPSPAEPEDVGRTLPRRLATRRGLLERVLLTRRMLAAWRGAGKYLSRTTRPLTKPTEATDLLEQMERIRTLLGPFSGQLGEAGKPGYLVASLARQALIVPTIQTLLPSQRAALARDWQSGLDLLTGQLSFLRGEYRHLRRRSGLTRGARAVALALRDEPGWILFVLGMVALNLVPAFRAWLFEQVVVLLGLVAFRLFLWWDSRDAARRYRTPAARRSGARPKTHPVRPA